MVIITVILIVKDSYIIIIIIIIKDKDIDDNYENNAQNKDNKKFLLETGYSSKLVKKEMLWARKTPRNEFIDKDKSQEMIAS